MFAERWSNAKRLPQANKSTDSSYDERDKESEDEEDKPRKQREDDPHDPAICVLPVPGGAIRIYFNEDTEELFAKAVCDCHGACTKQRTLLRSKRQGRRWRAAGRPIGLLVAWLRYGMDPAVGDAHSHKWDYVIDRNERKAGRAVAAETEGGDELLDMERSPRASESDGEPQEEP